MHRIDHVTASADENGAGKDGFTEGDPTGGVPPTVVTDDWLNDIQENIATVIESQGITLVKGDHEQLSDAIDGKIDDLTDPRFVVSRSHTDAVIEGINGGTGPGVKGTGGVGAGTGVVGTGGSNSGTGLTGTGGSANGHGVIGTGTGTGSGVRGVAGGSGYGVYAQGKASAPALGAIGIGAQDDYPSSPSGSNGEIFVLGPMGQLYAWNPVRGIWAGVSPKLLADATTLDTATLGSSEGKAFSPTATIAANSLRVGSRIRASATMRYDGHHGNAYTFQLKLGTSFNASIVSGSPASVQHTVDGANGSFSCFVSVVSEGVVKTLGAGNTAEIHWFSRWYISEDGSGGVFESGASNFVQSSSGLVTTSTMTFGASVYATTASSWDVRLDRITLDID